MTPPFIILDTGPLSNCVMPRAKPQQTPTLSQQCRQWLTDCENAGVTLMVPAISYYETLRELERRTATAKIARLKAFSFLLPDRFIPLATVHLERAAHLWGAVRNRSADCFKRCAGRRCDSRGAGAQSGLTCLGFYHRHDQPEAHLPVCALRSLDEYHAVDENKRLDDLCVFAGGSDGTERKDALDGKLNLGLVALSLIGIILEACSAPFLVLIGLEAMAAIFILIFVRKPIVRAWAKSFLMGIAVVVLVIISCYFAAGH